MSSIVPVALDTSVPSRDDNFGDALGLCHRDSRRDERAKLLWITCSLDDDMKFCVCHVSLWSKVTNDGPHYPPNIAPPASSAAS